MADWANAGRFLVKSVLTSDGFRVIEAQTGTEALEMLEQLDPDVVVLDVMMPGMDGPATLKALRALPQTAAIPVIFLTGKVQIHEVRHYKKLGALDVIPKPFDPRLMADKELEHHLPGVFGHVEEDKSSGRNFSNGTIRS